MKKTTRRNITQNATLEALVTPEARRQAESLGVPLESFISAIASKSSTMPVTLRFTAQDIRRLNNIVDGGRIHEWCESTLLDVLECEEGELQEKLGNRITLDLSADTAARLRAAAEFEEMSVEEYLMDGLGRDLDLSGDLMDASKN